MYVQSKTDKEKQNCVKYSWNVNKDLTEEKWDTDWDKRHFDFEEPTKRDMAKCKLNND